MKNFTSPKGNAGFTNLIRPDTKFDEGGVYKTSITCSADAAAALIDLIDDEAVEELGAKKAKEAHRPYKVNEDGTVTINFKSKATDAKGNKRPAPKLFDGQGNPIRNTEDLHIGSGSVIKVKGAASAYTSGKNIGVTLYINSVQIIKLVEYNAGGFEADDEADFVAGGTMTQRIPDSAYDDEPAGAGDEPAGKDVDF
jgi:hypothetical protein